VALPVTIADFPFNLSIVAPPNAYLFRPPMMRIRIRLKNRMIKSSMNDMADASPIDILNKQKCLSRGKVNPPICSGIPDWEKWKIIG
jgi:hypothetical protein